MTRNTHRLKSNLHERAFVDVWREFNEGDKILRFILDRHQSNRGTYIVTAEEGDIVETVIQWLGSPVGQGFLVAVKEHLDA